MATLTKTTIKEQVYRIIREKILSQEYALGERINIDALANELQVSNSPIREAIMLLEKDGLVTTSPNNGARVVTFTDKSFRDFVMALYALLSGAYDLSVEENSISKMTEMMKRALARQKKLMDEENYYEMVKYSILFEKSIFIASGNEYLLSVFEHLEGIFYLMILHNFELQENVSEAKQKNIVEHEMILKAIEKNDTNEVKHWLRIHYDKHF